MRMKESYWEKRVKWVKRENKVVPHSHSVHFFSGSSSNYFWDRPDKVGSAASFPNGTMFMRGPGRGTNAFLTHQRLRSRDFIKEGGVYILLTMEGM